MNYKSTAANTKVWYGEAGPLLPLEYWVAGLGIYDASHLTVLSYYPPQEGEPLPPTVNVVSLQTGESASEECLPIRGFEGYSAQDYALERNVTTPSSAAQPLFLLSPRSVVKIQPRSVQDHIDWALEHDEYERAIAIASDRASGFSAERVTALREKHLEHLFATDAIEKAAQLCPAYLGKDVKLWERWIARFNGCMKLQVLLPHIPLSDPRLPLPVYTLILNYFLYNDVRSFLSLLRTWPRPQGDGNDLYDPQQLLHLLEGMVKSQKGQRGAKNPFLLEALAELYAMTGAMEQAVDVYLENGLQNVEDSSFFRWVEENGLVKHVKDKALQLFRLNAQQAAVLLVEHMNEVNVGRRTEDSRVAERRGAAAERRAGLPGGLPARAVQPADLGVQHGGVQGAARAAARSAAPVRLARPALLPRDLAGVRRPHRAEPLPALREAAHPRGDLPLLAAGRHLARAAHDRPGPGRRGHGARVRAEVEGPRSLGRPREVLHLQAHLRGR